MRNMRPIRRALLAKVTQGQPAAFSFTISDWNGNTNVCT